MLVFIDESGDHNLDITKSDHTYDIFVLSAVLISEAEYKRFDQKLRQIKIELFGNENFIFHTREMTRPSRAKDQRNKNFVSANFRHELYAKLNFLIDKADFEIVASVIMKEKVTGKIWQNLEDPYIFSFNFLLDRILHHCHDQSCKIFPEKRTHVEDLKLELAFLKAKNTGTKHFRGSEVSKIIKQFSLTDKVENKNGLQLADLIASPIGRYILGKKPKLANNEIAYSIISEKIAKNDLLIFP